MFNNSKATLFGGRIVRKTWASSSFQPVSLCRRCN